MNKRIKPIALTDLTPSELTEVQGGSRIQSKSIEPPPRNGPSPDTQEPRLPPNHWWEGTY